MSIKKSKYFRPREIIISKLGFELVRIMESEKTYSFERRIGIDRDGSDNYYYCTAYEHGGIVWIHTIFNHHQDSESKFISFADVFEILNDKEKDIAIFNFDLLTGKSNG